MWLGLMALVASVMLELETRTPGHWASAIAFAVALTIAFLWMTL